MRKLIALLALLAGSAAYGQGFNWPSGSGGGIGSGGTSNLQSSLLIRDTPGALHPIFAVQSSDGSASYLSVDNNATTLGTTSITSILQVDAIGQFGGGPITLWTAGSQTVTLGTGTQTWTVNAPITFSSTVGGVGREFYLGAYDAADNSTSNKIQTFLITNASTLKQDAGTGFTGSVVGVGGGNYVVKLCSDGATCSGANLKATCTISCTAAVGTTTACTVNNAAISAATTLTLQPSTACATTAESGNFAFHLTIP